MTTSQLAAPQFLETQRIAQNPLVEGLERLPVHPTVLVVLGATGDLARRKLLPALYNLAHEGALPERFEMVGVARSEESQESFRHTARQSIERFSRRRPDPDVLERLLEHLLYVSATFDDDSAYHEIGRITEALQRRAGVPLNRLYYLSTAPQFFPIIADALGAASLNRAEGAETRIVIEKPFGYDLASARALNARLREVFEESQIFRIDHYLGKETVQNLMVLRFANSSSSRCGTGNYIDHVQITVAEDIGRRRPRRRTTNAGALRDMVQNHCCSFSRCSRMEPPTIA